MLHIYIAVLLNAILIANGILAPSNINASHCKVPVSEKVSQYVPYLQTFRTWGTYPDIHTRINYRIAYTTSWIITIVCCEGYRRTAQEGTDAFTCNPICEPECRFGICTAPNTCTCNPLYAMNEENTCVPICSKPCVMGTCVAPEVCKCNDGYGLLNSSTYICEPICEKACVNGMCTAPGICTCNQGYWSSGSKEEEQVCKPICRVPCYPYGDCILPDICSCFEGYQVNTSVKIFGNSGESMNLEPQASVCVPVCNEDCVNGKCIKPNVCRCNPGYYPSLNNSNVCEPFCDTLCGSNSFCKELNSCTCLSGYKLTENEVQNVCEPNCEVPCGSNSTCVSPNVCACDKGYEQDDEGRCKPFCSSCYNGTCVAPDYCQCLEGFILTNDTVCLPLCKNGCANGECVAPDVCQCHDGFENKGNDSGCIRSCKKVCKGHGVCVDDEKPCECSYGWTGLNCDQPTVCISLMNSDDEILAGLAIYNETNSTLIDAKRNAPYCYQCNETISNKSFCFTMAPGNVSSTIGCFVETESPCYSMYHDKKVAAPTMTGVLSVVTISIMATMAAVTTVTYFVIRRRQRRNMHAGIRCRKILMGKYRERPEQSALFQGSIANESLLSEEDAPILIGNHRIEGNENEEDVSLSMHEKMKIAQNNFDATF